MGRRRFALVAQHGRRRLYPVADETVPRARQIRRLDRPAESRHRQQAWRFRVCEAAYGVARHCEERSDEATQWPRDVALNCFATLAMTVFGSPTMNSPVKQHL